MNKRQLEILGRIIEDPKFYTVTKLSKLTDKSVRTIYNDLNDINRYFAKNKLELVQINEQGEVSYQSHNYNFLENISIYDYEFNSDERVDMIICMLLLKSEYITLQMISELLFCSRSTVLKDIKEVKDKLANARITLISNQNKGFKLSGQEIDMRNIFLQISERNPFLIQLLFTIQDIINVDDETMKEIEKTIFYTVLKNQLSLTDSSQQFLMTYLVFMMKRIENHNIIENYDNKDSYKYHIWSQEIIDRLFNGIEYESEMNFLSKVLGNMRFTKKITNEHSFVTIHILVTLFIEEVSKELDIDLTQDKELFTNLSNHMFDILNNSYSQNIESQELKYVMEKNYSVVSAIKNNVYVFENYISRQLSMIEIGYLSLHILASLEKEKILKRELRVLLICNSGIGTSRLLKTRLDNHYVFNIVDILSVYELEIYDISNIDLIISTVQLDKDISVPYAQVGVHLNEQDLKIINSAILKIKKETSFLQKQNNIQKQDILQHIQPYFSGYKDLYEQVESLIQDYFRGKVEEEQKNLSDFLNEDMILLDEEANDWHQVIVKSIMPLEKKGMVTNHFKDEIIQSVENYGDYIMISDNVVFPHAGFEQGAKLTGVTFARFTTPTYISDPQKTIDMAFGLSASDNKKHVKALFTLVELVNNPDFKNKLMNAKEKKDIIHIIKEFESCQKEGK